MDAAFGSWGTQTFVAGLTADATIAFWAIEGAMDGTGLAACVEKVPVPELEPGTTRYRRHSGHPRHAQERRSRRSHAPGCRFPFLPPYITDPNPMEMAFSKLKAHLCRIGARTFTDMFDALAEIRELRSPQKSWNDFKADGYISS